MSTKSVKRVRRHSFTSLDEAAKQMQSSTADKLDGLVRTQGRKRSRSPEVVTECSSPKKVAVAGVAGGAERDFLCLPGGKLPTLQGIASRRVQFTFACIEAGLVGFYFLH